MTEEEAREKYKDQFKITDSIRKVVHTEIDSKLPLAPGEKNVPTFMVPVVVLEALLEKLSKEKTKKLTLVVSETESKITTGFFLIRQTAYATFKYFYYDHFSA